VPKEGVLEGFFGLIRTVLDYIVVPVGGLEPPHIAIPDFESNLYSIYIKIQAPINIHSNPNIIGFFIQLLATTSYNQLHHYIVKLIPISKKLIPVLTQYDTQVESTCILI
jgi:hypothetical protein